MANISQIKKIQHVITPAEALTADLEVLVLWDSAFNDTNYVVATQLEIVIGNSGSYLLFSIHDVTSAGFTASVSLAGAIAGDTLVIHAMASHK